MEVDRLETLRQLQLVSPGLASKDLVEQSKCFVFGDGKIRTFNDEIFCSIPTTIPIQGAVQSEGLLAILNKLTQDKVEIDQRNGELLLKVTGARTGIVMEEQVSLPVDSVEIPTKWKPLPAGFSEAIDLAKNCAATDESRFDLLCVHLHPEWIEACDGMQMLRFQIKTGLKTGQLVRATSVKHLAPLGVTHFAVGDVWIHFTNKETGLIFSLRRYEERYPDMTSFYDVEGTPLAFPGGIREMVEKANIFSSNGTGDLNQVLVEIKQGKIRIKGSGAYGWHQEVRKTTFDADEIRFMIPPKLLIEFSDKANECIITSTRLLVDGGKYKWLGCLEEIAQEVAK